MNTWLSSAPNSTSWPLIISFWPSNIIPYEIVEKRRLLLERSGTFLIDVYDSNAGGAIWLDLIERDLIGS